MKKLSKLGLVCLLGVTGLCRAEKPNFLFLLTDDQSFETIHALGNDEIHTPNLDRLAEGGTSFSNAYNMGAWHGAVCVASRTMLVTGRSVWRANKIDNKEDAKRLAEAGETWPQLLKQGGYETYMTGKWHVKVPTGMIFDHVRHERPGMPNQTPEGYMRPVEGEPDRWSPSDPKFEGFWKGGKHWSEVLADDAELFLKQAAESERPFFMYLAFNAPHDPRQAPQEFVDMYPPEKISVPESFLPEYPYKQEIGCYEMKKGNKKSLQRDEKLVPWPRTEYAVKVNRGEYYASITHLDEQIGKILKALEATGKMDNTYVIMTSDHGLACGNHGLIGKQNMYEDSVKPPLLVMGPSVPAGEKREAFVYLQDVVSTTLDLAGLEQPDYIEFNSLMPLIKDADKSSAYPEIYGCYTPALQRMVRVGDDKLIVYPEAKVVRLFDLENDPLEMKDLAGNPENKALIKRLFMRLLELKQEMEDPIDLESSFPGLAS